VSLRHSHGRRRFPVVSGRTTRSSTSLDHGCRSIAHGALRSECLSRRRPVAVPAWLLQASTISVIAVSRVAGFTRKRSRASTALGLGACPCRHRCPSACESSRSAAMRSSRRTSHGGSTCPRGAALRRRRSCRSRACNILCARLARERLARPWGLPACRARYPRKGGTWPISTTCTAQSECRSSPACVRQ
jgi:hypothetical protein